MINDEIDIHMCNECGAEFTVQLTYDQFEEMSVQYCPVCGSSLEEDDLEGYEEQYNDDE